METNLFFSRDSEAVWHPKCDHGRLVGEVRGQDDRDKWKQTFFSRDSEAAFGTQSATMGAGFGPELDWEKLWRDQVSGAKMTETNRNKLVLFLGIQIRIRLGKAVAGPGVRGQDDRDKWKQTCFFLGIQRQRLAPKVRPWEARWGGSGPR